MTHEVVLHGYNVKPSSLQLGTFDSYGIEKIHVTADDEWAGLDILAVFHAPNGTATKVVVGADGMLAVPPEATAKQADVGRIVFVGLAENVQRITVDMGYNIKPHSDIDGDNPGTPTPDVVQQILENSNHAVSIATAAQKAAENARQAAEDAAKKAGEGAGGAAASAAAAKKSAEDAAASSESAAGKAEESASSASAANESAKAAQTAQGSAENAAQTAADAAGAAGQAADAAGSAAKASRTSAGEAAQSAEAAETAKQGAEDAAKKALEAKTGSENALHDANAAKDAASGYANAAAKSATAAADSEKNAAKSANSAAESAAAAKKSADNANNTANSIKDSMTQISENKEAVSQLKEDTAALKKHQNVLVGSETGNPISCNDAYSAPLCGLSVYGKSMQDGTPSPDSPVPIVSAGDDGSVVVRVTGKNRMPPNLNRGSFVECFIEKNTPITLVFKGGVVSQGGNILFIGENNENLLFGIDAGKAEHHVTFKANATKFQYLLNDTASENVCLTWNASSPDYEPYREQILTLPTPNGLPGIPVTSGGNYTDQSGQQWVCDEVDLERGVKVQRVNIVDLSTCAISGTTNLVVTKRLAILLPLEGRDYKAKALCNKLKFIVSFTEDTPHFYVDTFAAQVFIPIGAKNPEEGEYILFYVLDAPIETPLTPAEIAAYKALTAYGPDTVVQASDGAGIKLDYQRDVNLVVKNLEDAIASMTTT
jgi:hypothetical protein|nr:MAG TPA: hypothetical protein [Caudoviricetes sp.]